MGVGSYFAKFIHKDLLNKFVEIEILVGVIGGISSVVLFFLFNTIQHFEPVLYLFVFVLFWARRNQRMGAGKSFKFRRNK